MMVGCVHVERRGAREGGCRQGRGEGTGGEGTGGEGTGGQGAEVKKDLYLNSQDVFGTQHDCVAGSLVKQLFRLRQKQTTHRGPLFTTI